MSNKNINIDLTENFKSTCKRHCDIIETCLLDFEKYGILELLKNTANSINQIKISSKSAGINNAAKLATYMQDVINFAIEGKLNLYSNDIDVLLRANDLFYGVQQFSASEVFDLFEFEEIIIDEIISEIKAITAPRRIKKAAVPQESLQIHKIKEEADNKTILLEKFKYELVKSTHAIQHNLESVQDDSSSIDVAPISTALNTIKGAAISAGIDKAFNLADSMQDFLAFTANNNIPISSYQMDILVKCNRLFKEIAASSAIAIIDKFNDYSNYIDSYTNFLQNFLDDYEPSDKRTLSRIAQSDISLDDYGNPPSNQEQDKLFYFGYKSSNLKDASKYNRMLELSVSAISNLSLLKNSRTAIKELKANLRQIQLDSSNILYNIADTEKTVEIAAEIPKKLDALADEIDKFARYTIKATEEVRSKVGAIYSNLFNLRSIAFGDIILGLSELAADIAKHSNKKVKLKITGRFVRVGIEVASLLEIALPQILMYIIVSNIESVAERQSVGKSEVGEISIAAQFVSSRLLIDIEDGMGTDSNLQAIEIESIINLIRNHKGKISIQSESGTATKISLTFDLDYVLLKSLLFELEGELYAIQMIDSEGLVRLNGSEEASSEFRKIDIRQLLEVDGKSSPNNNYAALAKHRDAYYAIYFDKFIGEAELAPTFEGELSHQPNYIVATSTYNGSQVTIIDADKLLDIFVE